MTTHSTSVWRGAGRRGRVMAIPPGTLQNVEPEAAAYQTLLRLLAAPDLSLISIWSPTFLTGLVRLLQRSCNQVVEDVEQLVGRTHSDRVKSILNSDAAWSEKLSQLWPRLAMITCWADGSSAHPIQEVRDLFPRVDIQPKGLISTEAFVSFPLVGLNGSLLSVMSHYFEFQPLTSSSDDTLLAGELSTGERYRVIVTTGGGLYRYQTHDVIEVVGHVEQCPRIRFCGRGNQTCDLVGEKLSEEFVATAISQMAKELAVSPTFAMLVPHRKPLGYRLLISFPRSIAERPSVRQLTDTLNRCLSKNPYYEHAVRVGQLAPVTATIDDGSGENGHWDTYESRCLSINMRQGDIKAKALETRFDWSEA